MPSSCPGLSSKRDNLRHALYSVRKVESDLAASFNFQAVVFRSIKLALCKHSDNVKKTTPFDSDDCEFYLKSP